MSSPTPQFKASILQCSAFFMVQLSHPYMTTGKTIVLTRWTFVGKVMSLLFNMLSRLVIDFSSKERASFNFMAAVTICSDFGAPKLKFLTVSNISPSICHEVMGPDNPDSILKIRDITLSTKVHLVKAMVFQVVMYGCESWTIKKAEH